MGDLEKDGRGSWCLPASCPPRTILWVEWYLGQWLHDGDTLHPDFLVLQEGPFKQVLTSIGLPIGRLSLCLECQESTGTHTHKTFERTSILNTLKKALKTHHGEKLLDFCIFFSLVLFCFYFGLSSDIVLLREYYILVKRMNFRARLLRFKSRLYHLLAVWYWKSYLISLVFGFLMFKLGMMITTIL